MPSSQPARSSPALSLSARTWPCCGELRRRGRRRDSDGITVLRLFSVRSASLCSRRSVCLPSIPSSVGVDAVSAQAGATAAVPAVELRIVSRSGADTGRVLHRETLGTLRGSGPGGGCPLPSQLQLLSDSDLLAADCSLPILLVSGPLVRQSVLA